MEEVCGAVFIPQTRRPADQLCSQNHVWMNSSHAAQSPDLTGSSPQNKSVDVIYSPSSRRRVSDVTARSVQSGRLFHPQKVSGLCTSRSLSQSLHHHHHHHSACLMGLGEGEMSQHQHHEMSAVLRASSLPLVRSALQQMTSAYLEVKGRYPLLRLMGGVAEVGVRSVSQVAMTQATPLLQSLEPQIEVANSFALVGLDRLEKNFPILNQSTDEVMGHLKDAFFLTLDDVQLWVVDGMDGALDQLERLSDSAVAAMRLLQDTQVGRAATSGLDDVLSRLEDATAYYLPLPPTLRREWEMRVQEYEDEDEDADEPSLWTRVRSLLLSLYLQLYHRMNKIREQLQRAVRTMGDAADKVGLSGVLDLVGELLDYLQRLLVALVYRAENLKELTVGGVRNQAVMLAELRPIRQVRELPVQIQQLLGDLQELTKLLLQLVINATPLYNMLQQPSAQEVEDFLNQEDFTAETSSRRSSANSLFLKAMDGRPRRRRSLYSRAARGSSGSAGPQSPPGPQSPDPSNGPRRRSSLKDVPALEVEGLQIPSEGFAHRRPSATDLLLAPLKQFVSQSQKAFEYLSPNSPENATNGTNGTGTDDS
ncbi:perilipin 6 isoform X2 [Plectropomus leopardus]|uniref:perilipin 6 isoform X2 n=1 Tax=Plectropomus leopardus TaxID=160734 RepID=UPI001C4BF34C|nr:perilipin 6 isoform X2 [Plectropomus leopardus]